MHLFEWKNPLNFENEKNGRLSEQQLKATIIYIIFNIFIHFIPLSIHAIL